ncbi:SAM hydrolase/SAM-dependent halogenase family protein [Salinibaculum rarum]|uniref:SAM hydrolase/SAM-dependent halogenase family protein n=1 Tax=Salinibaculum rarum TaxID=3058903 RepID=UPI00265EFF4D|nr:SAM-dependent chlorinase/fluorinase [Salinibaculum sp. KK48]
MITLSSDFGSPYPAAMKGVLCQHTDARLVDISHDFPRQDVRATAFWLQELLPYFPPAVHLVVVDPGVGTDRDALVVRAGEHVLVGPDNGILLPAARRLGDDIEVFAVDYEQGDPTEADPTESAWPPRPDSQTFHGRDLFAPAAAHVHDADDETVETDAGFERTDEFAELQFPEPTLREDGATGEVLTVDSFGNVITNIPGDTLAGRFGDHVQANGISASVRHSYAAVDEGHRVVTVGSHGNVELAVNQGRGDRTFGVDVGNRIRLSW